MKPEDEREIQNKNGSKLMRCDRCGTPYSLDRHGTVYRCPVCIWDEREDLITEVNSLIALAKIRSSYPSKYVLSIDDFKDLIKSIERAIE